MREAGRQRDRRGAREEQEARLVRDKRVSCALAGTVKGAQVTELPVKGTWRQVMALTALSAKAGCCCGRHLETEGSRWKAYYEIQISYGTDILEKKVGSEIIRSKM